MTVLQCKNILGWFGLLVNNKSDIVNYRGRKFGHLYSTTLVDDDDADMLELTSLPASSIIGPDQEKWVFTYLVELVLNTVIDMSLYKKDQTILDRIGHDDYNDIIGKFPEWFYECVPTHICNFSLPGLKLVDVDLSEPPLYAGASVAYNALTMPGPDYQAMLDEANERKLVNALENMFNEMVSFSQLLDLDVIYHYLTNVPRKSQRDTVLNELDEFAILWSNKYAITHSIDVLKEKTNA